MTNRVPQSPQSPFNHDRRPIVGIVRAPVFNASETFVRAHALGLKRYQPVIIGLERKGHVPAELENRLFIPGRAAATAIRLLSWERMAERLRVLRPSLLHAHFATDGAQALPLARALGIPLVTTLHGYDVSRSRSRMMLSGRLSWMKYALWRQRLIGAGSLFLAVSEAVRDMALSQGFPAERTLTHYLGVDLQSRGGAGTPEPGLILHVGRLVEKKGTAVLLEAFQHLRLAGGAARLVIVGDGPERPSLERQVARRGISDSVHFTGALPPADVTGLMQRAWFLATPSLTARDGDAEGLPTVLVEAAAASLPAVASRHSGIPEAVIDGATGFLVPEGNAEALAARMADLLASPELRQRMGQAARELAVCKFDFVRQTALLEDHYDRLVVGARRLGDSPPIRTSLRRPEAT